MITDRQLRLMVAHLGPDTPLGREVNGPWSQTDHLLWDVGTQLRLLRRDLLKVMTGKSVEIELYPRPDPTDWQLENSEGEAPEPDPEVQADLLRHLNDPQRITT